MMSIRLAALAQFIVALWAPPVFALTLTNCTQKKLSVPGCRSAASVLDNYAVFVMATSSDGNHSGLVDIYNAATMTWQSTRMPTPSRTNMCATSWQHLAIFAGGSTHRGQPKSKTINVWDSRSDTWTTYNMSIGRDLLACASVGDFTIFAGGSAPQVNQSETDEVDIWNHRTGAWTQGKLSQKRKKPEAVTAGGKIVIAGGEIAKPVPPMLGEPDELRSSIQGYSDVIDIFDPNTGTFSTTHMPFPPRQYFGAASAGDHAVFAGGFYNDIRLGNVDIYDAAANAWSRGPSLSHNRSNLQGTSVGEGRYAAFGSGNIRMDAKLALDVYDSSTGILAASIAHAPGNPAVAAVKNVALFLGCDGVFDALAADDHSCSGWNRANTGVIV